MQVKGGFDEFQFIEQQPVANQRPVYSGVCRYFRQHGQYLPCGFDCFFRRCGRADGDAVGGIGAPFALGRHTQYGMAETPVQKHQRGFARRKVGDTVTFKAANKGHWVQSKALPDGVADFLSEDGKDFTLKLDKEGVYVYTCPPHRMMNMSGVIQVGKPVNKAKAQAVVDELENRAMQSKGRLKKYMQQVK